MNNAKQNRVKEIKKLDDGRFAVKWHGSRKFVIVDAEIGTYLICCIIGR